MKKYLASLAVLTALAAGTAAAVAATDSAPDPVPATEGPLLDDPVPGKPADQLGSPGRNEPVDPGPIGPPNPSAVEDPRWLVELLDSVEAKVEGFAERVVGLTATRSGGVDPSADLIVLADDVAVFGEGLVTGVAITPSTVADVPDLAKVHADLISGVDALYAAVSELSAADDDAAWDEAAAGFLNAADRLARFAERTR